ncbi:MAG TPA: aquaporin [Streptosporangiaceae bacterium]|jgi:aquaporin Z
MARRFGAEFLGTLLYVFFGVGVATFVFGFRVFGFRSGGSVAAAVLITGLAFGLTLMAIAYVLGPISGCHVNPAVTLAAYLSRRMPFADAVGYWVAQLAGGFLGALLLYGVLEASPLYLKSADGLGTNGWGPGSFLHMSAGGVFIAEVILTAFFVFVVLGQTAQGSHVSSMGLVIGLTLAGVHLIGVPIDGTSVNPARSLGPALITGGTPLNQVWLFLVAPLVGSVLAAGLHLLFHPVAEPDVPAAEDAARPDLGSSAGSARHQRPG